MIYTMLALQLIQTQPVAPPDAGAIVRPTIPIPLVNPGDRKLAELNPRDRQLAEARSLLTRAAQVEARYSPRAGEIPKSELEGSIAAVREEMDSLSEMGEMDSLRLQMAMDRMSRLMTTLSNILKTISDTQNSIIQNIR